MINNKTTEVTESNIPYYISNGKTNQLRANLLFPFMCFNEEISKRKSELLKYFEGADKSTLSISRLFYWTCNVSLLST